MKKAETPNIGFVCSFDMAADHEIAFSFNPSKMIKYSARKGANSNSTSSQKQGHQTKTPKNAALRKASSQPQRLQGQNSTKITVSQTSQSSQIQPQAQLQSSAALQQAPSSSQVSQNKTKKNLNSKIDQNDQNLITQTPQQQPNIQSNNQQLNPPQQPDLPQTDQQLFQAQQNSIQRPNISTNISENINNNESSISHENQKQTSELEHATNPATSLSIPNSSLAYKNPIYQPIFGTQKVQPNQPQTQPSQPPPPPQKPPQAHPKTSTQSQQQQAQIKSNQAAINQAIFTQQIAMLLNGGSYQNMPNPFKLQIQVFLQQLQLQQKLKQQQQQQQQSKQQSESKTTSSRKKSRANENDDFTLRSDTSKKSAKVFIPSSTTMYSTHHRNHKPILDQSDTESDTYVPCSSSSPSQSSSSSEDNNEEEEERVVPVKHRVPHSQKSGHPTNRSSYIDHSKSSKKIYIKPIDPRVKLKRRYASWAEITDYGQWKWAAKDRPHIIENPRQAFEESKNNFSDERSKPLEFDHEFTLLECLRVVSNDLQNLQKDVTIVPEEKEEEPASSDSHLSKSSSITNLNGGLTKSDSNSCILSDDKNSLASVISPVIAKRRLQRPNHIRLAKIIDNFDMKMRNITCRACSMLDRLLLREILKNSAPSLHQSLQQIAPFVWRDFQSDHLQSSKKENKNSTAGSRRKKKKAVTLTAALEQSSIEVEDAFHVIKQTFEFLNVCEKEETNYACEIRHMNFSRDYTFQPSYDDLVRYFRQVKGMFVSRSSSGYILE